uniref:SURF1-like protein n=1 Tax=Wuchereria bancrofti TaxID=6293 RepID=A0A1I8EU90_WUCBA
MMNIPGGLTNKLLQYLISDKNIKCLLRRSMQNPSIYDATSFQKNLKKKAQNHGGATAAPLVAFALGAWQLQRLQWKTNLLKKIEERTKQEAVPFPDDNLSLLDDLEYAKVKVTGEFLHDHEFYVQPRQRFDKGETHLCNLYVI